MKPSSGSALAPPTHDTAGSSTACLWSSDTDTLNSHTTRRPESLEIRILIYVRFSIFLARRVCSALAQDEDSDHGPFSSSACHRGIPGTELHVPSPPCASWRHEDGKPYVQRFPYPLPWVAWETVVDKHISESREYSIKKGTNLSTCTLSEQRILAIFLTYSPLD